MSQAHRSLPATFGTLDSITLAQLLSFRKVFELESCTAAAAEIDQAEKALAKAEAEALRDAKRKAARAGTKAAAVPPKTQRKKKAEVMDGGTILKRITALEEHLGEKLFIREDGKGYVPNRLAHQIMGLVRQIIFIAEQLHQKVDDKQVVVGFSSTVSGRRNAVLLHLLGKFAHEGMRFHTRVGSDQELIRALSEGEVDVAIIMQECLKALQGPQKSKKKCELVVFQGPEGEPRVFSEPSVVLLSEKHQEADAKGVSADLLRHMPLICFPKQDMPELALQFEKLFESFLPRYTLEDWDSMLIHVLGGHGMAIGPKSVESYQMAGVKVLPLTPPQDDLLAKIPVWDYAIVKHVSNAQLSVAKVAEAIAEMAAAGFQPLPQPQSESAVTPVPAETVPAVVKGARQQALGGSAKPVKRGKSRLITAKVERNKRSAVSSVSPSLRRMVARR